MSTAVKGECDHSQGRRTIRPRSLAALAIAALTITTLAAGPAAAAPAGPDGLTAGQVQAVRTALAAGGATVDQVAAVLADRDALLGVPVSTDVTVTRGVNPRKTIGASPMTVGSSCSGSSSWVSRTQYIRNVLGGELARFVLRTDFCYNGKTVTYSNSTPTGTVTTLGNVGGVRYEGLTTPLSEGYRVYNGKTNGEVKTQANGKFVQSPIRIGSIWTLYPIAITYVRYNGSYTTGGSCDGCTR